MKSQDILLLLKLVALERRATEPARATPEESLAAVSRDVEAREQTPDDAEPLSAPFTLPLDVDPTSVRGLSSAVGISKSEVSNALSRCYTNGLAKLRRNGRGPIVNRHGLEEFLAHGVRFVFPGSQLGLARGVPTCLTAPIFGGILRGAGDHPPVWADPLGDTLGLAVEPLYRTAPAAIRHDDTLYMLLAIVDSIRLGQPRERKLAITQLQRLMDY